MPMLRGEGIRVAWICSWEPVFEESLFTDTITYSLQLSFPNFAILSFPHLCGNFFCMC